MRRTTSTIPFGYELSEDGKEYIPIEKELELLKKAAKKQQIKMADIEYQFSKNKKYTPQTRKVNKGGN